MARRILVIFNPAAGRPRRSAHRLRRVVAELDRQGCTTVVRRTQAAGDARRLAREAEPGFDLIVAAGGDGTVNEVANGLDGSARPLAVLPLGTGNVLANEIGLPRAPAALARLIACAPARPIWPGRIGDRLFVAMAGVGFDAEVLNALDQGLKRRIGKLAFVWAVLACLRRGRRGEFVVSAEGSDHRAASAIVANGRFYAGRFVVARAARAADPVLHVVLFRRAGRIAAVRCLAAMMLGILHRLPEVSVLPVRGAWFGAGCGAAEACLVQADGEIVGRLPAAVAVAAEPLLLVQPVHSHGNRAAG